MRLLLDTHILIWWHENNLRLSKKARTVIADAEDVFISMASFWETAIRLSTGRFKLFIPHELHVLQDSFKMLDVTIPHAMRVMALPWYHRDPFDRMLIAQAQTENLYLMTDDRAILRYDVQRVEV